ncbi:MAG: YdcF family protein [Dongiaceae bacterium]
MKRSIPKPRLKALIRRDFRRLLWALALAALLFGAGLIWFVGTVPRQVADTATRTDAVVVLTGGAERLTTGLKLLQEKRAKMMLISGVGSDVEDFREIILYNKNIKNKSCCVELGRRAEDTLGNAEEAALWMRTNHLSSLRLVTAAYHMPRSLLEFQAAMPDAVIIPHPVFPANVRLDEWWKSPGTAGLLAREFVKYLVAAIWHQLVWPLWPLHHE